jgi:hypothetical protein
MLSQRGAMPKRVVLIRHDAARPNGFMSRPDRLFGGI